jgi:hypothetical protein
MTQMTETHPITPPPELVRQWLSEEYERGLTADHIATQAAQWGADQELDACCEWIAAYPWLDHPELLIKQLRAARRPKPPSLKEQALQALAEADLGSTEAEWSQRFDTIRRALEQLSDNE